MTDRFKQLVLNSKISTMSLHQSFNKTMSSFIKLAYFNKKILIVVIKKLSKLQ